MVRLARCFGSFAACRCCRPAAPPGLAGFAARLAGRGFPGFFECAGEAVHDIPCVTLQRQTRKTTISPNSRSMSDSRRSVDPTEVGQAKPSGNAERVLSRVLKVVLIVAVAMYFAVAGIYL